jgi:hypothetical protein
MLNRMPLSFRRFFFRPKPYLLVIYTSTKPSLVKGHNELQSLMFDGTEILEQSIYQSDMRGFLSGCEVLGTRR